MKHSPIIASDFYADTETAEDLEIIEDTGDFEINFTDYLAEARS